MVSASLYISYENIFSAFIHLHRKNIIKISLLKFNKELKTYAHKNVIVYIFFQVVSLIFLFS